MRTRRSKLERYGYLVAIACIAAATALFVPMREYFAKGQWSLIYLLIISVVASLSGVRAALLAAVLAFFVVLFILTLRLDITNPINLP